MATLDIPNRYLDTAPVIVTSPTTRCGTTLVQRLLSASDNAFVYGEEVGNQMRVLTGLFSTQIVASEKNASAVDDSFWRAVDGTLDEWRPGLAPPAHVTLEAWTDIYYRLPLSLSSFGRSIGRPIWGFKWPACPGDLLKAFLTLMPRARVVYVVRNLEDALKSAKARKFVRTEQEVAGFCAEWAANMGTLSALRGDLRIMPLGYETLLSHRRGQVGALEAFTGAAGIRISEFELKVNTFAGDEAEGHSRGGYIEPAALTEAERALMQAHAGAAMSEYDARGFLGP